VFWVISVYFNIRNTLPKSGTFLLGHSVYIHIYIYIYVCVCVFLALTLKHTAVLNSVCFMLFYVYMVSRFLKTIRDHCLNPSLLTDLCNGDTTFRLNTLGYEAKQSVNSYRVFGCTCFHYLQGRGGLGAGRLLLLCLSVSKMLRHFHLRNITIYQLARHRIPED
jgi:hypothetical protein